jgi:hypothetical protein
MRRHRTPSALRNRTTTCACGRKKREGKQICDGCQRGIRKAPPVTEACQDCGNPELSPKRTRCRPCYAAYARTMFERRQGRASATRPVKAKPTAEQRATLSPRKRDVPAASGGSWWAEGDLTRDQFMARAYSLDASRGKPPTLLMPMNWPMASGR